MTKSEKMIKYNLRKNNDMETDDKIYDKIYDKCIVDIEYVERNFSIINIKNFFSHYDINTYDKSGFNMMAIAINSIADIEIIDYLIEKNINCECVSKNNFVSKDIFEYIDDILMFKDSYRYIDIYDLDDLRNIRNHLKMYFTRSAYIFPGR